VIHEECPDCGWINRLDRDDDEEVEEKEEADRG
jgi:hypothetical protein